MIKNLSRFLVTAALLSCGFMLFTSTASASVIGVMQLGSGANTVTVTATSINWNGTFSVSAGTTLTYDGGTPLAVGTPGNLVNLTMPFVPVANFITFPSVPVLDFNLGSLGPGSANTNCAGAVNVGDTCSVFAGSPFILTLTATGTTISLSARGTATDGTIPVSNWIGNFSTTITSLTGIPAGQVITPAEIQAFFASNPNAAITSPYSGTFVATIVPIPEPSTSAMLLAGGGLILFSMSRRRRQTH